MPALTRAFAVLALSAAAPAVAAPIGPDNYDFATFDRTVLTHDPAHFGGWTQVLADLDGDGRLDRLVYATDAASWRTWTSRSHGDGTFGPSLPWQAPGSWLGWTLSAADVDGDGADDLVLRASDQAGWRSYAARSLRDGAFAPPVGWTAAGDWSGWTSFVADVTGDHRADLLLCKADASSWQIALAAGDGSGRFASPVSWSVAGSYGGWRIGVGDFDGDGRADVSLDASDPASWRTWVALATPAGSFAAPVSWVSPGDHAGWTPARGDFDADGRTDLLLWKIDAAGWRAKLARADGAGGFAAPTSWSAPPPGPGWTLSIADVNGDRGDDLILQRTDAAGWQALVAVGSGGGAFLPPRPWGAIAQHFGGWLVAVGDVSGDGRADLIAYAVDAVGWRAHVAVARGCDDVIRPGDDFAAKLVAPPGVTARRTVCVAPGRYTQEILIADQRDLSLIAAHGDVTLASTSYAFAPDAIEGQDPGAPVQIARSTGVELDGFELQNQFTYRIVPGPDGEPDQTYMVSRAIEILDSTATTISNSHLLGPGKQLVHTARSRDTVIEASRLDCYYFCIDARESTIEVRRSTLRAEHATATDVHAMLWTDHSDQRYLNCTFQMITGKSLFAGVNDFASNSLELAGHTEVDASAQAWVSQHPNYDGLNVTISGVYPALADWYFIDWMGGGWQAHAQICYQPASGPSQCVSHFE